MRVFVTGSEGFVGRYLTDMLVRAAHDVRGADIRARDNIQAMTGPDLAIGDIPLYILRHFPADIVIHLAGSVSTLGSIERPMETFRNTVRTAVNVIDACRLTQTPLILTSSVKARDGMTPYGAGKRMVELWAMEYAEAYKMPIIINRPGTIYGPGQEGSPESGWIAWFTKAKREGLPIVINGDGSQVRDLLHVRDYCRLIMAQMAEFELYQGRIWDVGGGPKNAVSVKEIADHLKLEYTFGPPRHGDVDTYIGENICPTWEPEIAWQESETLHV